MKQSLFTFAAALLLLLTLNNADASLFIVDAASSSARLGEKPNTTPGVGFDTGIYLSAGQTFMVSVDPNDLWNAGDPPRWSNANGLTTNLLATGTDESHLQAGTLIGQNWGLLTQSGFAAPYGSLVGELGGTFFLLGTNFSGPAPSSGILKLFFWDENNYDNMDSIAVNIVTVPESASFILFGLGLIALTAYVRVTLR
jgi:hypothetical protein